MKKEKNRGVHSKDKKIFLVSAIDSNGIARVYGVAPFEEDAKLNCIIALAEYILGKFEKGMVFKKGFLTDFDSYDFQTTINPDGWSYTPEPKNLKQMEFNFNV